jgi:hypothetical protein
METKICILLPSRYSPIHYSFFSYLHEISILTRATLPIVCICLYFYSSDATFFAALFVCLLVFLLANQSASVAGVGGWCAPISEEADKDKDCENVGRFLTGSVSGRLSICDLVGRDLFGLCLCLVCVLTFPRLCSSAVNRFVEFFAAWKLTQKLSTSHQQPTTSVRYNIRLWPRFSLRVKDEQRAWAAILSRTRLTD